MSVTVDLSPLVRFRATVSQDLRGSGQGPVRKALHTSAQIYRSFAQERFSQYSRGGGDWLGLSPSTLASRRRKSGGRLRTKSGRRRKFKTGASSSVSGRPGILWDTGTMIAALNVRFTGKPGAIEADIPFGVRVGYGGQGSYPDGTSIADIAAFHQHGGRGNRPPRREIIVDPDTATMRRMADVMEVGLQRAYG